MLNRDPLVRFNYGPVLKNVTNLRGEVDPEEDQSSQSSQSTGQTIFDLPQYQIAHNLQYTNVQGKNFLSKKLKQMRHVDKTSLNEFIDYNYISENNVLITENHHDQKQFKYIFLILLSFFVLQNVFLRLSALEFLKIASIDFSNLPNLFII